MLDNRNTILAVILSGLVLIAWQYFYNIPQMEKQRAAQQAQAELQKNAATQPADNSSATNTPPQAGSAPAPTAAAPAAGSGPVVDRDTA
ncbi:MAG TPA: membrane protein insertase YidC, partial [Bradyrhizobium sp.]|nr:membrane protein insertase YidC [Bradyrhizobium sp.]